MKQIQAAFDTVLRRWPIVGIALVLGLGAGLALLGHVPRNYEAASHVLIVNENDGRDPTVTSIDLPSVATSSIVLERVIDRLKIDTPLIDLQKAIKAKVGSRSSIMEIAYRDASPSRAVSVPNAVAEELAHYYAQISTQRADQDIRKLDFAIAETRARYERATASIAGLTADNLALGSDRGFDTLDVRLDDLRSQRDLAAAALSGDAAAADAVSPSTPEAAKIASNEILSNDQYLHNLVTGTAKDEAQLAFRQAEYTSIMPGLDALHDKVSAEHGIVAEERTKVLKDPNAFSSAAAQAAIDARKAAAVVIGDRSKVAAIDALIADTSGRLGALPQATARYNWLRLQRDAAQADYLTLAARRTSAVASRAEALSLGTVVVLDRAVRATTSVVGIGRTAIAAGTAAFVVLFAIAMAFLAEAVDPRLRRKEQIENLYGTPLIVTLGKH